MEHPDEVKTLTLSRMFGSGGPLVARIIEQLEYFAAIPTLRKTQLLTADQTSAALDVAFWASLGFNEGRPTRTRLLFAEPELLQNPLRFDSHVAYAPLEITKLSPAEPEGGCICVSPKTMTVWGLHPSDPGSSLNALSLAITAPGVVHVRIGPLRPYAVVSNGKATILADAALALPDQLRQRLDKSLTGDDIRKTQAAWRECLLLAALARRVLQRGHGGTLLLVPSVEGPWTTSIELAHRFTSPDTALRDAVARELNGEDTRVVAQDVPEALKWQVIGTAPKHLSEEAAALRRVAPYASVDGAVVITRDLEVIGFGAKIVVPKPSLTHVFISGPHIGVKRVQRELIEETGGTRHQSAARFVAENETSVAVVISHDAHISLFFWDEALGGVSMIRNVDWWD